MIEQAPLSCFLRNVTMYKRKYWSLLPSWIALKIIDCVQQFFYVILLGVGCLLRMGYENGLFTYKGFIYKFIL